MAKKKILTDAQITQKCLYWQKRLRLQDWDIQFHICNVGEMPGDKGNYGYCEQYFSLGQAKIYLLRPSEIKSTLNAADDIDATITHELLHIVLEQLFKQDDQLNTYREVAVEKISKALVGV